MKSKITLRKLSDVDKEVLQRLANNKKIADNLRDVFPHPYSIIDAENFIQFVKSDPNQIVFVIEYQEEFAGIISFIKQKDVYRKTLELGYWLGEDYWNKGIATKAIELMISYAKENLDTNRITAVIFDYNLASMKVLENNGFLKESISKEAIYKNGNFYDSHNYYLMI